MSLFSTPRRLRTACVPLAALSLAFGVAIPAHADDVAPTPTPTTTVSPQQQETVDTGSDSTSQPSAPPQAPEAAGSAQSPVELTGQGRWIASGSRWWWRNNDGSYPHGVWGTVNGTLYAFDGSGWMRTGWFKDGDVWYYLTASGAMAKGWAKVAGTWYYLDPTTGKMATGWLDTGGTTYYLTPSGAMHTGWLQDNGSWYYLTGSGAMAKGWAKVAGTWYYLDPTTGKMATGWLDTGGTTYYLTPSGAMHTGWLQDNGSWYYLTGSGAMAKGWAKVAGTWYYLDPTTGKMATGTITVDGKTYYLTGSGAMATGWTKIDGAWYYYSSSGDLAKGWLDLGGTWYYLDPTTGKMATGTITVDGKTYNLSPSGAWIGYTAPAGYLQPTDRITPLGWATNELTPGMNGVKVRIVQQRLGISNGSALATANGTFQNAVRNFQRRAGLPQTGVVDQQTWNAMGTGFSWWVDQYQATPIGLSATKSERIEAMIGYAWNQLGSSYTWGGAGTYGLGFDCSGLVLQSLYHAGMDPQPINVIKHAWPAYRTSRELYAYQGFMHVPFSQRQRGDIVFYRSGGTVVHVSIYLGNDQVTHTDYMGRPARVDHVTAGYSWGAIAPEVVRPFP